MFNRVINWLFYLLPISWLTVPLLQTNNIPNEAFLWCKYSFTWLVHYIRHEQGDIYFFSPDGSYLAAGSADGAVYIWNKKTGNLETKLAGIHRYARCWFSFYCFIYTSKFLKTYIYIYCICFFCMFSMGFLHHVNW